MAKKQSTLPEFYGPDPDLPLRADDAKTLDDLRHYINRVAVPVLEACGDEKRPGEAVERELEDVRRCLRNFKRDDLAPKTLNLNGPDTLDELRRIANTLESESARISANDKSGDADAKCDDPSKVVPESGANHDDSTLVQRAVTVKFLHPDWTDQQVADAIGCKRETLFKPNMVKFKAAKEALKLGKHKYGTGKPDRNRR